MKKLLLAFLFVPLISFAQVKAGKPVICFKPDYLKQQLEQSKEVPLVTSRNVMTEDSTMTVFYNEETGTWTIIEFGKNFGCVLGYGIDKKVKI
jgi:hypothetical protein